MFIKSEKQESIINLDRVFSIRRDGNDIRFYYSGRDDDFDYWEYDSKSARDEDFEKIEKLLNAIQNKILI